MGLSTIHEESWILLAKIVDRYLDTAREGDSVVAEFTKDVHAQGSAESTSWFRLDDDFSASNSSESCGSSVEPSESTKRVLRSRSPFKKGLGSLQTSPRSPAGRLRVAEDAAELPINNNPLSSEPVVRLRPRSRSTQALTSETAELEVSSSPSSTSSKAPVAISPDYSWRCSTDQNSSVFIEVAKTELLEHLVAKAESAIVSFDTNIVIGLVLDYPGGKKDFDKGSTVLMVWTREERLEAGQAQCHLAIAKVSLMTKMTYG